MDVKLPKLGEGAETGSVVSILVKEGERIEKGQTILELENEKAVAPIPSPIAGTVSKIRVKEGDKISVGHTLLTVDDANGDDTTQQKPKASTKPKHAEPEEAEEEEREAPASGENEEEEEETAETAGASVAAAPSVRKIARELGIDLGTIRGSEGGGRIIMADLRNYVQRLKKSAAKTGVAKTAAAATPGPAVDFTRWGDVLRKPMSSLRQTISRRMTENWNTIPHVTQFDEADITGLLELRKQYAAAYEAKGTKLTLTSFAIKAVVLTLQKHAIFNSSLDEAAHEIVLKQYYHIGLAVDTDYGLIVPVIRNADKKNLLELSREVSSLAEKARDRKLSLEDLQGGTFTISNQGGIGGGHFTPIVNKPEAAILGLGRGAAKPVVQQNQVQVRQLMPVTISYDHRIIDGGSAARFCVDLIQALQEFKEDDVRL